MEAIYSDIRLKLEAHDQQEADQRAKLINLIAKKELNIHNLNEDYSKLNQKLAELEQSNADLREELLNLSNVSLLKKMHIKLDKLKHTNTVLKKRLKFYKVKCENHHTHSTHYLEKSLSSSELNTELNTKTNENILNVDLDKASKSEKASQQHTIDGNESNDEEDEEDEEDEVVVELIKIKRRYYYSEHSGEVNNIYKAIKIKKGDYDLGDLVGTLVDGKLVKTSAHM